VINLSATAIFKPSLLSRRAFFLGVGGLLLIHRRATAFSPDDPGLWRRPRVLRLMSAHTGQRDEFVYWRDGQTITQEYEAIGVFCKDHHSGKAKFMSLRTLNLLYAAQEWSRNVTGAPAQTTLTSAFRSDETNDKIGGHPNSFHPSGRALDGLMDGLTPETFSRMLGYFKSGGVGMYKKHVHWDDGPVRYWRAS